MSNVKMTRQRSLWSMLLNSQGFVTDNIVFRLHYKLTLPILLVLSVIIGFRQQFGTPIICLEFSDLSKDFINDYCYVHSTYSIVESWKRDVGTEVPYPGIIKNNQNLTRVYHYYYKWVSLVLFLQAVLFLVPRYFWKAMESGRIHDMISGLKASSETSNMNFHCLANQVTSDFSYNGGYFALYLVAEVLNVINVIGQISLMDAFLGGAFISYGSQALENPSGNGVAYDHMLRVFPRLTMCTFNRYGSSGDMQRHNAMCHLPINILNEKVYLFLWFWFIILAILSCLAVVYRLMICISPRIRMGILMLRTRPDAKQSLQTVLKNRGVGDWFVIYLLSKNLKPSYFKDFVLILGGGNEYVEPKRV